MSRYETVIGLEVHVQLAVRSKLFSTAEAASGGEPNTRVVLYDLGLPGQLPQLNAGAIELAVRAALALDGSVQERSTFARKHYFYPDLPKGYQISQFDQPFCIGGRVPIDATRHGALERIHLEEDAGKLTHDSFGTLVDLNRAGRALIEVVGKPDLRAPSDAAALLTNLRQILRYSGVSDCDMEKGSMRCDANVSLRLRGDVDLGPKVEIKNLNSMRMVQRAIEYEERRQAAVLEGGGRVEQETRLWDDLAGHTQSMRSKEGAADYRYLRDPDLPCLRIPARQIRSVQADLPELPDARRRRYSGVLGLPDYDVGVLTDEPAIGDWFEAALAAGDLAPKAVANWVMTEVLRECSARQVTIADLPVTPPRFAALLAAERSGRINRGGAKKALAHMIDHDVDVDATIDALGLAQITDPTTLATVVKDVLAAHPEAAADYRAGVTKALHALKGQCMRATQGKADPEIVERLLLDGLRASGPQ